MDSVLVSHLDVGVASYSIVQTFRHTSKYIRRIHSQGFGRFCESWMGLCGYLLIVFHSKQSISAKYSPTSRYFGIVESANCIFFCIAERPACVLPVDMGVALDGGRSWCIVCGAHTHHRSRSISLPENSVGTLKDSLLLTQVMHVAIGSSTKHTRSSVTFTFMMLQKFLHGEEHWEHLNGWPGNNSSISCV